MKRYFLLVILGGLGISLAAQTLEDCRRMARGNYPEIRQYDLISATESYNVSNAARAWIPQVSLSGQATYQSAAPTYPDAFQTILANNGLEMAGVGKGQYKVAIDVRQNLWDGGQSAADRAIAEAEADEQRRNLDVALYDVQSRVDNLYFGILLLDERILQIESSIKVLESNLNRVSVYRNNGVAMQSDVDAIEAELLIARQSLSQTEASRSSYRRMLEVFIGQPLTDKTLPRPVMQSVASRRSARPELAMFDSQENKLDAQRKAIKSSVMPRFSLFAQGYYGYPGLDMFKSMMTSDWSFNALVGVSVSWNLGAFNTKGNNLRKLDLVQRQIDVNRDVFLFNTEMQMLQQDGEIARLKQAVSDDERIVELRSSVRRSAESKLENGVIDATDLLQKIADETTAKLNRSTHQIELLQAIYGLKTILNQ